MKSMLAACIIDFSHKLFLAFYAFVFCRPQSRDQNKTCALAPSPSDGSADENAQNLAKEGPESPENHANL